MAAQRVAIVDYGMCNLDSVRRAFEEVGARPYVTDDPGDLDAADRIVLPGVGAFPDAMQQPAGARARRSARQAGVGRGRAVPRRVPRHAAHGRASGEEVEPTDGLGWIDARCVRFVPTEADRRVPHVGWNEVTPRGRLAALRRHPARHRLLLRALVPRRVRDDDARCWRPRPTAAASRRPCSAGRRSVCSSIPRRASAGACACSENFLAA